MTPYQHAWFDPLPLFSLKTDFGSTARARTLAHHGPSARAPRPRTDGRTDDDDDAESRFLLRKIEGAEIN